MKRKWLIIISIVIIIVIGAVIGYKILVKDIDKKMDALTISDVDLTEVEDGTYDGHYKLFPIEVEVKVLVKDHKIVTIDIVKHFNGKGKPAEVITDKVIEKQSLKVDTISGATGSSKVILKAIEKALID